MLCKTNQLLGSANLNKGYGGGEGDKCGLASLKY
jgi:hypothetical protein